MEYHDVKELIICWQMECQGAMSESKEGDSVAKRVKRQSARYVMNGDGVTGEIDLLY